MPFNPAIVLRSRTSAGSCAYVVTTKQSNPTALTKVIMLAIYAVAISESLVVKEKSPRKWRRCTSQLKYKPSIVGDASCLDDIGRSCRSSAVTKAQQSVVVVCCDLTPSSEGRTNHHLEGYLHVGEGLALASKEGCHDVL